ncbi:NUDIX hydrolase [Archangium sp. Cb G35]|uniref:NUDIX hydrolase n=1 Tax=Archangium sp. Cb G35 TaxID=1920190 RepID=UPI000937F321|nr:NUDIX hydrolase [Archangium sp. Cb G35]OJT19638.1 NUDIX hydrolase [Archangium sp. Cb G35]
MSDGRAWEGNWKTRLYERIRDLGYESLTAFASAHPTDSLVALAEKLGEHAERSKQVTRFVRDVFVRMLSQSLPEGWPAVMDDANRFKVAKAIGRWSAYTPETHEKHVEQARAALRASPPPAGWRPLGPDDELLLTLLPDEEV